MKIRIAVASSNTPADLDGLSDLVDGLEKRRFDTLWLSDTPLTSSVEPLLALAIASGRTTRLKLGTNVVVSGRNPLHLAKELAHLDRLTSGRLLLAFMPGIGSSRERAALGVTGVDRSRRMETTIDLCRSWWSGESVTAEFAGFSYEDVKVGPAPLQDPLEIWLGGNGPKGLELAGTHADGWLGSRATPGEAEISRRTIETVAVKAGRSIDDDHFGISIPYARSPLDDQTVAAVMRKTDADRADILPFGAAETRALIQRHIDAGITKFVLRPMSLDDGWDAELDFLAEHTLPLQN
ncbi:MAG: LLM class flavin-dependent oxidoreductase [Acidimicrobiales bacterium]|jgi:probable F420-dependent oxidoreductase